MQDLKVSIIQTDLNWVNPVLNRDMLEKKIKDITEPVDLVVLPEVFTTGFTIKPSDHAEPYKGETLSWMERMAAEKKAVLTGSIAVQDNDRFYNRMIWMQPDGKHFKYDKKHLFTFAGEQKEYTPGKERVVVKYKGWKFFLLICYDLRFPVWCKNTYSPEQGFEYDCIINIANWPAPRSHPWSILLTARAIENQAYVIGVNRIGTDGNNVSYSGYSAIINPLGETLTDIKPDEEKTETVTIQKKPLEDFRKKFRVANDWDKFRLIN